MKRKHAKYDYQVHQLYSCIFRAHYTVYQTGRVERRGGDISHSVENTSTIEQTGICRFDSERTVTSAGPHLRILRQKKTGLSQRVVYTKRSSTQISEERGCQKKLLHNRRHTHHRTNNPALTLN